MSSTVEEGLRPLGGVRILDMSTFVAGPSATMTLAQYGADVIRIDPLGGAPDVRRLPHAPDGSSLYWTGLNRGKRFMSVDTRQEAGRQIVRDLLGKPGDAHGILVTNAVGQDWLAYEALRQHRPDMIHLSILGHSDGGPAVDYTIGPETGLPWVTGPKTSTEPVNHVLPAWDLLTGLHAALSLVVAVQARRATGAGQSIVLSLADVAAASLAHLGYVADEIVNGGSRVRDGNFLFGGFGAEFALADRRKIMVVALTGRHWQSFVDVTDTRTAMAALETLLRCDFGSEADRYRHREAVRSILAPWFAENDAAMVLRALSDRGILWGEFKTLHDMAAAPDGLVQRSPIFHSVTVPGIGSYPIPGAIARNPRWASEPDGRQPSVGRDTQVLLETLLALDDSAIVALKAEGVLQ